MCEPVDHRHHQAVLSLHTYSSHAGVTEGNVIHIQIEGNFIFLSDAGESGKGIKELHFAAWLVSDYGTIHIVDRVAFIEDKRLQQLHFSGQ